MSGAADAPTGTVLGVCVATDDVDLGKVGRSAINKRPVDGRVAVGELGLTTDHVVDTRHHGGLDQAVYAYDDVEARRWADELGRELPYGWFGENLRVVGMPVTDAPVGQRWAIGDDGLVVETTIPRVPCRTFAAWADEQRWVRRFMERADVGTYLRVITPGTVGAGDPVTVLSTPDHGVRVRDLLSGTDDADALSRLLAGPDLAPKVKREASKFLARALST